MTNGSANKCPFHQALSSLTTGLQRITFRHHVIQSRKMIFNHSSDKKHLYLVLWRYFDPIGQSIVKVLVREVYKGFIYSVFITSFVA